MKTYNIYTEILQEVASYNKRISTATANNTDHVKAQQLRDRLFDYEHKGYITWNERKMLYPLVNSEMIDNAKQQEAKGIKPGYCFYNYKNGENITPPGWLVYSTYQDGAGVVYKTDKGSYILIKGWQSEFCLV